VTVCVFTVGSCSSVCSCVVYVCAGSGDGRRHIM